MVPSSTRAETSHNEPRTVEPLTALRFFAAFWVVMYHYWPKLDLGGAEALRPAVVAKGYLGVEVFFVLSGFILCHVYLGAVESGRFRYGDFIRARFARVYPLHLFTLLGVGALAFAATLAGMGVGEGVVSWPALPANVLMVHAWGLAPEAAWNHPSWSISAEWFAYLSFPAFAAGAMALRGRPNLAVALAVALLFGLYAGFEAATGELLTEATVAWGALRIVPCFTYGCALFLLWRSGAVESRAQAWTGVALSLAALGLTTALRAPDAATVTAAGALIFSLAGLWSHSPEGAFTGPLSRVGTYLGEISYSIYMIVIPWALVFVNGAAKVLDLPGETLPLPVWLLMTGALIPLAALSYHLVEKPARRWLRGRRLGEPHPMAATGGENLGTTRDEATLEAAPAR